MTRLAELLEGMASREPDATAVIDHDARVSFAAFAHRVRRTAAWLSLQGLRPGDVAGMTVRDEYRHLVVTHALLRLGCVQVALASQDPPAMRAALAARCRVDCVIGDSRDDAVGGLSALVPDDEAIAGDLALDAVRTQPAVPGEAAVLLTSSGTTGRPKVIACTQDQLASYRHLWHRRRSVVYRATSRESNQWKWTALANLSRGHTLVFADPARHAVDEVCRRHRVDVLSLSPVTAVSLAHGANAAGSGPILESVRVFTGGERISAASREAILRGLTPMFHVQYGATECGIATVAGPHAHRRDPDTVGHPIEGVELRVVDDAGAVLPAGEIGFVRIRSPGIATSYYDDDEASARMFRDGWFQPGDVGCICADGSLRLLGRGDDMMILNTINIFPREIEAVGDAFTGVAECAAFALRSAAYGDIPLLAVVARDGFDAGALLAHCRARLGKRAPRKIVVVERLPRNEHGKVMRRELSERFRSNR